MQIHRSSGHASAVKLLPKRQSCLPVYNSTMRGRRGSDDNSQSSCTLTEVMKGNFPWGNNAGEKFVIFICLSLPSNMMGRLLTQPVYK